MEAPNHDEIVKMIILKAPGLKGKISELCLKVEIADGEHQFHYFTLPENLLLDYREDVQGLSYSELMGYQRETMEKIREGLLKKNMGISKIYDPSGYPKNYSRIHLNKR
jgi:hypothetical protein